MRSDNKHTARKSAKENKNQHHGIESAVQQMPQDNWHHWWHWHYDDGTTMMTREATSTLPGQVPRRTRTQAHCQEECQGKQEPTSRTSTMDYRVSSPADATENHCWCYNRTTLVGTTTTTSYKWYDKSHMMQMTWIPSWQGKKATSIDSKRVIWRHGLIDDTNWCNVVRPNDTQITTRTIDGISPVSSLQYCLVPSLTESLQYLCWDGICGFVESWQQWKVEATAAIGKRDDWKRKSMTRTKSCLDTKDKV
jgi:hypothetical protein